MFKKLFQRENKAKNKCYCCQDKGQAIDGYRVAVNNIKCTLQIIGNKNNKDFGVLLNEVSINYCPICRKKTNRGLRGGLNGKKTNKLLGTKKHGTYAPTRKRHRKHNKFINSSI